jgi:hypothetical protein
MAAGYLLFCKELFSSCSANEATREIIGGATYGGMAELTKQYDHIRHSVSSHWEYEEEFEQEYRDSIELLSSMVKIYFWATMGDQKTWVPMLIEQPFRVPILNKAGNPAHLYHKGVFDLVVFDVEWKSIVLVEFKTTLSDTTTIEKRFEFDPQICGYLYALRYLLAKGMLYHPITKKQLSSNTAIGKVSYNVLRKKVPSVPKFNKNGRVSSAAIDTLPKIYEKALLQQDAKGLERTEKQSLILHNLKAKSYNPYFRRYEHYKTRDQIMRWASDQIHKARKMRRLISHPEEVVRSSVSCTLASSPKCQYRAVCEDDTPEIRKNNYIIAANRHEECQSEKGFLGDIGGQKLFERNAA